MNIGVFSIITGFIATIVSLIGYFLSTGQKDSKSSVDKGKNKKPDGFYAELAHLGYYVMLVSVIVACVYLYYLIIDHQFQYKYVYQYTSKDLSLGLLISTFWAGQEGSFLLWTFFTAFLGLFFMRTSGRLEAKSMIFVNGIMFFFFLMLIKASPFAPLGANPADGAGLNPLLQNFWMIIHPPILFVGYAAIAFPFAMALAALWRKEYDGWIETALPWTIFSSLTLGAGIIIGAFWAYETLGWGGYWGWDPVENSSLIPWLTILALLHGLIVQKRNGSLRKTNFFLAIISYILVLYATFLTRSGVLEDFSVHSFQNLGLNTYLVFFMIATIMAGSILFLRRMRHIPVQPIDFSALNRENGLMASLFVFGASAFLTFKGTSSPIITGILGDASQVDISFYDKVNLPVGIVMAILVGITPFLLWVEKDHKSLLKKIIFPSLIAIVSSIILLFFGDLEIGEIVLSFTGFFALWANLQVLYRNWRISWRNIAGPLSHFGLGIVLVSIVISGNYSSSQRVILTEQQAQDVMDHQVTYQGFRQMPDGKNIVEIKVNRDQKSYIAKPRLFMTKSNEVMREPDVESGMLSDIYIAPLELRAGQHSHGDRLVLKKGESATLHGYQITFNAFDMTPHQDGSSFHVGAVLEVSKNDFHQTVTPLIIMSAQGRQTQPVTIKPEEGDSDEFRITLSGMDADSKQIELMFDGLHQAQTATTAQREQLLIEFSHKPFMSILWLGSILLIIGTFIALMQRIRPATAKKEG